MAFDLDGRAKAINALAGIIHNPGSFSKNVLAAADDSLNMLITDMSNFGMHELESGPDRVEVTFPRPPWANESISWDPNRSHYVQWLGPGSLDEDQHFRVTVDSCDLGLKYEGKTQAALAVATVIAAFHRLGIRVNEQDMSLQ